MGFFFRPEKSFFLSHAFLSSAFQNPGARTSGLPSPPPSDETAPPSSPTPSVQFDSNGVFARYKIVRAKIRQVRIPQKHLHPLSCRLTHSRANLRAVVDTSSGRRSTSSFGISSGWGAAASCAGIRSTRAVLIHGMERLLSSLGTHAGADTAACPRDISCRRSNKR
jgi:hypothetical protein